MSVTSTIYWQTGIMIFFVIIFVWGIVTISNLKRYSHIRDEYYTNRLDSIENLIKEELRELVNLIK